MDKNITDEVVHAFLNCSYKAFLKFHGKQGIKTEYEGLMQKLVENFRAKFFDKLNGQNPRVSIFQRAPANPNSLISGLSYIIKPSFESNKFVIGFDAIEIRTAEKASSLLYIPVTIIPNEKISPIEKQIVRTKLLALGELYGTVPRYGKIVYGRKLASSRFELKLSEKGAPKIIPNLLKVLMNEEPPNFFRKAHCQVCEFRDSCRQLLNEKDHLSLLGRMGEKAILKLNNKGIFTINQLSYIYRPKRRKKKVIQPQRLEYALKALALREKQTYVLEIPKFPNSGVEIYFDIEGLPEEDFTYLIGYFQKSDHTAKYFSFWVDTEDNLEKIFSGFINSLPNLKTSNFYHYGSYEVQTLRRLNKKLDNKFENEVNLIVKNSINILSLFSSHLYPPTYSNSLKEIAQFLGYQWADKNASGIQSIIWRKKWELTKEAQYKDKLIEYNADDCKALYTIRNWINGISDRINRDKDPTIVKTTELPSRSSYHRWGDPNFQIPHFEQINKFAYFDYQREKVYLKTNDKVRKAIKEKSKKRVIKDCINKPDKVLSYVPISCPSCGFDRFFVLHSRRKLIINLNFMTNGIKRWNLQLPGSSFRCDKCGYAFSFYRYGRNLMIWAMNQYISHLTSMPKIGKMAFEYFHIHIPEYILYRFKGDLAKEYKGTYEKIKEDLLSGDLIHADETKTPVRENSNSYVWVFTSLDTVMYLYRPNREADFLKEFLATFKGVLISDFYNGYDALPCLQQKCLIHLIRDLNNDLLDNQMNKEYRTIVLEFGNLLRRIVGTINIYGLRARHLRKHKPKVKGFLDQVFAADYETDLAISWQKRFRKNKDKLFTFLDYDNVPWNNNNAENAVKPLAKYRSRAKGALLEDGIEDYLGLLSVEQTCKYRGINFLEFLKSRKKEL